MSATHGVTWMGTVRHRRSTPGAELSLCGRWLIDLPEQRDGPSMPDCKVCSTIENRYNQGYANPISKENDRA